MRDRRLLYVLLAVAALAALFVFLRPGDDGSDSSAGATVPELEPVPTETTPTETTATAPTPTTTPTLTRPEVTRWRIDSRDNELDRLTVDSGTRVRIVVIADVRDHVHVHGYDLTADVGPGSPAVIPFRATLEGRFEIELEDRGREIAQLSVRP
jgi:hypothetical protein